MSAQASDRCPRCGGGFHCGANDAAPCACTALQLDAATLADLRARYDGCLCPPCLREIAASNRPAEHGQ
jgi:Cysteine-rich CWC